MSDKKSILAVQSGFELDRFLEFWNKTEGRDKFSKFLQFAARALCGFTKEFGYDEISDLLDKFWRAMLDSRRMQWFGKSLFELKICIVTLENANLPWDVRLCHATARFFFLIRWALENVMIMYRIGAITGRDWKEINVLAKRVWSGGLFFGMLTEILKVRHIEESAAPEEKKKAERRRCFLTILTHLGDSAVPAKVGYEVDLKESTVGLCASFAAFMQIRNLYPA